MIRRHRSIILLLCIFTLLTIMFSQQPIYFYQSKWKTMSIEKNSKAKHGHTTSVVGTKTPSLSFNDTNFIQTSTIISNIEECKTSRPNVMFLKTHKTASTAVQNILMRQALAKEWKIVLPNNKHDFDYPHYFDIKSVIEFENMNEYNLLCHHMRYNDSAVSSIMPRNTSYYVSIVREPGSLFQSVFEYFWPIVPAFQRVKQNDPNACELWLDNAKLYFKTPKISPYSNFTKNPTFFDFGYNNQIEKDEYIKNALAEIDKRFDFVMVADHFLESAVLLSETMCWSLEEMACLTLNARNTDKSNVSNTERIRQKSRMWNKADAAIFDHFNSTLWRKVNEYGVERMAEKVERLQQINADITAYCIEGGKAVDSKSVKDASLRKTIFKPKNVAVMGYNLRREAAFNKTCRQLIIPENTFTVKALTWQATKYKQIKILRSVGRVIEKIKNIMGPRF